MHHDHHKHCAFCDPPHMERNNYYFGKLMTVRDFFAEQNYFNQKRWLINKTVIGSGVVCGLDIKSHNDKSVILTKGLAIDCCGREILNCEEDYCVPLDPGKPPGKPHYDPPEPDLTQVLKSLANKKQVDDEMKKALMDQQSTAQQSNNQQNRDGLPSEPVPLCKDEPIDWHALFERYGYRYLLCAEYRSCNTEAVDIPVEDCGQNRQQFNRIRDSFVIRVKWEWDVLQAHQHHDHDDHDHDHKYEDHHFWPAERPPEKSPVPHLYDSICNHLRKGCPSCMHHCLILGRVIVWPKDELPEGATSKVWVQPCHERNLVYNNPLLFDLINSHHGDLPHVRCMNWEHGKESQWDINLPRPKKEEKDSKKEEIEEIWKSNKIYREGLRIRFDKPMNGKTLDKRTFLVSVTVYDEETKRYRFEYVRAKDQTIEYDSATQTATFKFSVRWLNDSYNGGSGLMKSGGDIFIELKGDFIMSDELYPKALDGNFLGGKTPSGNGTPGGDFVSWIIMPPLPKELRKLQEE